MTLPSVTVEAIIARYRAGETMAAIAAAEFVGLGTVHRVLKRAGVRARGKGNRQLGPADFEATIALYESGLTSDEVGAELGVSGAAIRRRLRDAGHPRRRGGWRVPS